MLLCYLPNFLDQKLPIVFGSNKRISTIAVCRFKRRKTQINFGLIQKYGNNFGLALTVNNKLRHVIAHYMVAVWYKPWSSMVQSMEPYGTMFDFPKSLGHSPKVFGVPPQRLWHTSPKSLGIQGLYHGA